MMIESDDIQEGCLLKLLYQCIIKTGEILLPSTVKFCATIGVFLEKSDGTKPFSETNRFDKSKMYCLPSLTCFGPTGPFQYNNILRTVPKHTIWCAVVV